MGIEYCVASEFYTRQTTCDTRQACRLRLGFMGREYDKEAVGNAVCKSDESLDG